MSKNDNLESVDSLEFTGTKLDVKQGMGDGDLEVLAVIKPKVHVSDLINGDVGGAIGNSKISIEITRSYDQDNVDIAFKAGTNLNTLSGNAGENSNFTASFQATKHF